MMTKKHLALLIGFICIFLSGAVWASEEEDEILGENTHGEISTECWWAVQDSRKEGKGDVDEGSAEDDGSDGQTRGL